MSLSSKSSDNSKLLRRSSTSISVTTGVIYTCSPETKGEICISTSMLGKAVRTVSPGPSTCYCVTPDGLYDILTGARSEGQDMNIICSGLEHFAGLSTTGVLYSWGIGLNGQLGLGPKFCKTTVPLPLTQKDSIASTTFTNLSCGDHHSCAIDGSGTMYAWGENFSRQLGLYRKMQSALPEKVMVEDMTFYPKFVPFSLTNPIDRKSVCRERVFPPV